jgi:hypothetical protein
MSVEKNRVSAGGNFDGIAFDRFAAEFDANTVGVALHFD